MERKREIRKIGNSHFIKLDSSDLKDFELKEGSIVDIDDITKVK